MFIKKAFGLLFVFIFAMGVLKPAMTFASKKNLPFNLQGYSKLEEKISQKSSQALPVSQDGEEQNTESASSEDGADFDPVDDDMIFSKTDPWLQQTQVSKSAIPAEDPFCQIFPRSLLRPPSHS
jgi:hypothetical protein